MTDDLPFDYGDALPQTGWATPRCGRHRWGQNVLPGDPLELVRCVRCHKPQDAAKVKAGRTSRKRGGHHELALSRKYGGTKVGHHGGPADIIGRRFQLQSKTHQSTPPLRVRRLLEAMDGGAGGRIPVLVDRYLTPGHAAYDVFTIRGDDWLALNGLDDET